MKFLNMLKTNWQTSLAGVGTLVVAGGATLNGAPVSPEFVSTVIAALGLLFARDATSGGGR